MRSLTGLGVVVVVVLVVGTTTVTLVDGRARGSYGTERFSTRRRTASDERGVDSAGLEVAFRRQLSHADTTVVRTTTSTGSDNAAATLMEKTKLWGRHRTSTKKRVVREYRHHGAISFLEPETAATAVPKRRTMARHEIHTEEPRIQTRVGSLAKHFKKVMRDDSVIDMPSVLAACHRFERAMVDVQQPQSARDLRGNIAKAEAFYKPVAHCEQSMEAVLRLEKAGGVHDYGPRGLSLLRDPSCAMGLLWIRRSLQFQHGLFQALLRDVDAAVAAQAAYEHTLQPYHGWALRQIYGVAVKSATPSNREWLARLGGFPVEHFGAAEEEATRRDLQELLTVWGPLIQRWRDMYAELDLEDQRRV